MNNFKYVLWFFIAFDLCAEELVFNSAPIKFSTPLIESVKLSNKLEQSTLSYIEEYYQSGPTCNVIYQESSPDVLLMINYKAGTLKNIHSFSISSDVVSYTPLRDIVKKPLRSALFRGYYLVSE